MPGRRGKKKCSEGASCPYKHEYQHLLEYYHDGDEEQHHSAGGAGRQRQPNKHGFQAFGGAGHSLVASDNSTLALGGRKAATRVGRNRAVQAAMRRAAMSDSSTTTSNTTTKPCTKPPSRKRGAAAVSKKQEQQVIILDSDDDDDDDFKRGHWSSSKDSKNAASGRESQRSKSGGTRTKDAKKTATARKTGSATLSFSDTVNLCNDSDNNSDTDDLPTFVGSNDRNHGAPAAMSKGMSEAEQLARAIALSNQVSSSHTSFAPARSAAPSDRTNIYRGDNQELQLKKAIANSNRDVVDEQDKEYYESLVADREKAAQKERDKEEKRQKEEMDQILQASRKQAQEEHRQRKERERKLSEQILEPEPHDRDPESCFIKLTLPTTAKTTTGKITRRFRAEAPVAQLFCYLRTLEELEDVQEWTVWSSIGKKKIMEDNKTSFTQAGLFPRVALIVKDENV